MYVCVCVCVCVYIYIYTYILFEASAADKCINPLAPEFSLKF